MLRGAMLTLLVAAFGCTSEPGPATTSRDQIIECVLAARYGADSEASSRTHEFISRTFVNQAMLEEGSFARTSIHSAGFAGRGDGMIAVAFKSDCEPARAFLSTRIEELESETEDREIRNQLNVINQDWHPITVEQYQEANW